jgi:hypothetical protein
LDFPPIAGVVLWFFGGLYVCIKACSDERKEEWRGSWLFTLFSFSFVPSFSSQDPNKEKESFFISVVPTYTEM